MRIGVLLRESAGPDPIGHLAGQLRAAAADGLASAWLPNIFGVEALTALTAIGREAPGLELGTAVIPTYPRHPAVLAQQARTASLALGGRLTLGIGLSHQVVIENMYGYSYAAPARHMREYLAVLLPLLAGEPAGFSGKTLSAHISVALPPPERRMPVLLAALAPRMLRLAGEQADGTILWMTGPATVRDYIVPAVTAAGTAAGRPAPRVVCQLPVQVTGDPARARADADKAMAVYGRLPSYRAMLDREGAAGPGDVAITGNEEAVAGQIRALAGCGVTDFVAVEYAHGSENERTRALLRALAADSGGQPG